MRLCLRVRNVLLYAGRLLQHFNAFETKETLAHDEMLQTDRRGSRMLAIDRRYIKVRRIFSVPTLPATVVRSSLVLSLRLCFVRIMRAATMALS